MSTSTSTTPSTGTKIVGVDIFGPPTANAKRLIHFYRDVLGMTPTGIDESETGAEFELADGTTFGTWQPPQAPGAAPGCQALFAVGDIKAAVALFRSRGAELSDVFETPVCFMSLGKDPDGNTFGIHQRKTQN
ncbi:MAG TPA: VOC family protein [Candidatus Lustribacter sp.]|jgi:predicted enzyme related to lactoylglutathione lyase|nr:VOC family protein [Candidatus Lustribacter sp.]